MKAIYVVVVGRQHTMNFIRFVIRNLFNRKSVSGIRWQMMKHEHSFLFYLNNKINVLNDDHTPCVVQWIGSMVFLKQQISSNPLSYVRVLRRRWSRKKKKNEKWRTCFIHDPHASKVPQHFSMLIRIRDSTLKCNATTKKKN